MLGESNSKRTSHGRHVYHRYVIFQDMTLFEGWTRIAQVAGATVTPATAYTAICRASAVTNPAGAHRVEKIDEPTRLTVGDGAALNQWKIRDVAI